MYTLLCWTFTGDAPSYHFQLIRHCPLYATDAKGFDAQRTAQHYQQELLTLRTNSEKRLAALRDEHDARVDKLKAEYDAVR